MDFTERGTKLPSGESTGIDHLKELGITHVHLLPVADFYTVDELNTSAQYNWGYDPLNFNTPEGWYSTDPGDGAVRIREFKQLVMSLHENGIGVFLDVVYNHTGLIIESYFNQTVPGYFYRLIGMERSLMPADAELNWPQSEGWSENTSSNRSLIGLRNITSMVFVSI